MQVNMHEAKTQLSRLVQRATAGEEVVIAKAGVPQVKLVPVTEPTKSRAPGAMRGQIWIAPDFDDYDAEIERAFYGEDE
jgi:prevent-host-death family protein